MKKQICSVMLSNHYLNNVKWQQPILESPLMKHKGIGFRKIGDKHEFRCTGGARPWECRHAHLSQRPTIPQYKKGKGLITEHHLAGARFSITQKLKNRKASPSLAFFAHHALPFVLVAILVAVLEPVLADGEDGFAIQAVAG